jgi:hypothetical protein
MASNAFAARAALYVADWAAGKVADVIIDRTTKRVVRVAKARTIDRFRRQDRPATQPANVDRRPKALKQRYQR